MITFEGAATGIMSPLGTDEWPRLSFDKTFDISLPLGVSSTESESEQETTRSKCLICLGILVLVLTIRILCARSEYDAYCAHFKESYLDFIRVEICTKIGMLEVVHHMDMKQAETVVLISPGNPGVAALWIPFLKQMHETNPSIVGIVGGYYGHCVRNPTSAPKSSNWKRWFTLEDQVESRVDFLSWALRNIPGLKDKRIVLAGHSLGSYANLKALTLPGMKSLLEKSDVKLFQIQLWAPTIVDLAESPKGKRFKMRNLGWLHHCCPVLTFCLRYLTPRILSTRMSGKSGSRFETTLPHVGESLSYVLRDHPTQFMKNYARLGYEEMVAFKAAEGDAFPTGITNALREWKDRIRVIHTEADHFAMKIPEIHAMVCDCDSCWRSCSKFHIFEKKKRDEEGKPVRDYVRHDFVTANYKNEAGEWTTHHPEVIAAVHSLLEV